MVYSTYMWVGCVDPSKLKGSLDGTLFVVMGKGRDVFWYTHGDRESILHYNSSQTGQV